MRLGDTRETRAGSLFEKKVSEDSQQ